MRGQEVDNAMTVKSGCSCVVVSVSTVASTGEHDPDDPAAAARCSHMRTAHYPPHKSQNDDGQHNVTNTSQNKYREPTKVKLINHL